MGNIWIVTNFSELGWDGVVGVFNPEEVSAEELKQRFPSDEGYYFRIYKIENNLEKYE